MLILSRLLRYSIGHDRNVQLKNDMNYVRDYLKLQQIRFNDRLEYRITVAEETLDVYVPKLLPHRLSKTLSNMAMRIKVMC